GLGQHGAGPGGHGLHLAHGARGGPHHEPHRALPAAVGTAPSPLRRRSMSAILSTEQVTKVFSIGRRNRQGIAGRDLSFEVTEGEFLCLIGASGCGKSTMLNMFAGFIQPSSGRVLLRGTPITRIEPRCGMVFQSYALFPWKTVRGNVEFGLKMKGIR